MEQTAVEWLWGMLLKGEFINDPEELLEQAKVKERSQKAEEYLKGFKDGKEYQIKLDELTFKSEKDFSCVQFILHNKTSSATKCICGREKWQHTNL
jgi:hypothetical protein